MQIKEVMTRDCETIRPNDSLRMAAQRMRDRDIGDVLVSDDSGKVMGILTDRDIAVRAVADAVNPDTEAQQYMSRDLVSCYEDQNVEDAAHMMEQEQVRRLLICDRSDHPVGILAQADLARALGRDELTGEAVEEISQPGGSHSQSH